MSNFLGPYYDKLNINAYESLYGPSILVKYDFSNFSGQLALRDNTARTQVSIPFVTVVGTSIKHIDLYLKMQGVVSTGTLTAALYSDASGLPVTQLGTSGAVQATGVSASQFQRTRFTFAAPVAVSASVTYHIVLSGTFTISNSNHILLGVDSSPAIGQRSTSYNGSIWAVLSSLGVYEVFNLAQSKVAQSFYAAGANEVDSTVLYLKKTGAPLGNLTVELVEDIGGFPSTTGPLNNLSAPIAASSLLTTQADIVFTFPTPPLLVDGRKYYLLLSSTGAVDAANNIDVGIDSLSPNYSGNNFQRSNNDGTWYPFDSVDMPFAVYYVEQALPTTLQDELLSLGDPPQDCNQISGWLKEFRDTIASFFPAVTPAIYGGTGMSHYQRGSLLVATSETHLEQILPGLEGSALGIHGGLPAWGGAGSTLTMPYYNNTASQIDPFDAVVLDPAVVRGIKTTVIPGDPYFAGIAQDIIPAGAWGPVLIIGPTQARLSGSAAAGDSLQPATIARRVSRAGTPGQPATSLFALQGGADGQLIEVFVNVNRSRALSTLRSPLITPYTIPVGTNVVMPNSQVGLWVETGVVQMYFQGQFENGSAATGEVSIHFMLDGAVFSTPAKVTEIGQGGDTTITVMDLVTGITPGAHAFALGFSKSTGGTGLSGFGPDTGDAGGRSPLMLLQEVG